MINLLNSTSLASIEGKVILTVIIAIVFIVIGLMIIGGFHKNNNDQDYTDDE